MKTPCTKEAYHFRDLFASHFGENTSAAETVGWQDSIACSSEVALKWDKAFQGRADASGRSGAGVHESADDTSYETAARSSGAGERRSAGSRWALRCSRPPVAGRRSTGTWSPACA